MSARHEGHGRTALITGASAGIGWHLAREFGRHDFRVVLVARTASKLEALAKELSADFGTEAIVVPADLTEPGAPQALFDELASRRIPVDVLVNNAGTLYFGPFQDAPLEELLALVDLNNRALLSMTSLFIEPMIRGGGGRVLNVASTASFQPVPALAVYAASKAFTLSLGEALGEELRDSGVQFTTLCPGFTNTDMIDAVDGARDLVSRIPAGIVLDPERVAREAYRACLDGVAVHIPGVPNQLAVSLMGWQPRWLVRALGGFIGRRVM